MVMHSVELAQGKWSHEVHGIREALVGEQQHTRVDVHAAPVDDETAQS